MNRNSDKSLLYVSYRRVSTEEQGRSGLGLEAQASAIARFVEQEGGKVIADFSDVMSGKHDDRPELQKAMIFARRQRAYIVTSKLDRLSRDVEFIVGLMNRGVKFVCADLGHDCDEFMLHIHAVVSQRERRLVGLRTREALNQLKSQGIRLGNPTNLREAGLRGYRTQAQRAVKQATNIMPVIRELQSQGFTKLAAIADELNRREVRTPRDRLWHKTSVARVLRRSA